MKTYNRITVSDNGFINRQNTKKRFNQKRERFNRREQPRTHSHRLADVATTRGKRPIMKAGSTLHKFNPSNTEIIYDKIQLPIDHRAHPYINPKNR